MQHYHSTMTRPAGLHRLGQNWVLLGARWQTPLDFVLQCSWITPSSLLSQGHVWPNGNFASSAICTPGRRLPLDGMTMCLPAEQVVMYYSER